MLLHPLPDQRSLLIRNIEPDTKTRCADRAADYRRNMDGSVARQVERHMDRLTHGKRSRGLHHHSSDGQVLTFRRDRIRT